MYQVDNALFTCSGVKANTTSMGLLTRGDCAYHCLSSPGCLAFTYLSNNTCELLTFGDEMAETVVLNSDVLIVN